MVQQLMKCLWMNTAFSDLAADGTALLKGKGKTRHTEETMVRQNGEDCEEIIFFKSFSPLALALVILIRSEGRN